MRILLALLTVFILMFDASAQAAEEFTIRIKDHKFIPEVTEVRSGEKVKLIIVNEDPTPEEFESYELNREKIIKGGKNGIVFIGPLEPGEYPFFGEFNMDSAKGKIVAK